MNKKKNRQFRNGQAKVLAVAKIDEGKLESPKYLYTYAEPSEAFVRTADNRRKVGDDS